MEIKARFPVPLVLIVLVQTASVGPCHCFTSFVFGDSLVDAGNNDYLFTLSRADSPPYGIDFKPSGGRPTGRFTNGRTIADIIGEALGAKSFPPPFLAPNSQTDALSGGINYASGASGILDQTGTLFIERVPLRTQVNYFEQTKNYMVSIRGENHTNQFLKEAIFSLTVGSNDVINYIQPSIPFVSAENISPTVYQSFMISNLTLQLKRLYGMGARKFIVVGIGPLGCIPFVRALNFLPRRSCAAEVNHFIQGYNEKLKHQLGQLNSQTSREAIFVYANSYDIFMEVIRNYQRHGFENVDSPCCGGFFPPFLCFDGGNENATSVMCDDRSKYVFWDAYHPTEAANVIVAKELLDGDQNISHPINIRQLYNHHATDRLG